MIPEFKEKFLIPSEILRDKVLTPFEKQVWVTVYNNSDEKGFSWGNTELAEYLGTSNPYVSQVVGRMRQKNYIEDVDFDGRKRWIAATTPEFKDRKDISY